MQKLVDFGLGVRYEDLPAEVAAESKRILLDSVGCALGGLSVDKGKRAVQVAKRMGGPPEASIIGAGNKLSAAAAVFANGELINALDFDVLTIPPGHVAPYILPAMLATAEKVGASGRNLLCAVAVGHEVSTRFGLAMGYYRDVTPGQRISLPPVSGYSSTVFGGTLGAAMIRGLDVEKAASALGLAGHIAPAQTQSKWGRTVPGSDTKYLMSGWIGQAETACGASRRAGVPRGCRGPGRGVRLLALTWDRRNGIPSRSSTGSGTSGAFQPVTIYKPYPHCRNTHTVLDCLRHLIEQHDLRPEEIERVTTYSDSHTASLPLDATKKIEAPADAQMSTAYAISMAVHRVKEGPEWHDDETMRDPRFLAFMEKVRAEPHPEFENALMKDPQSRIGKVEVFARGKTFSEERRYRKGSPATAETRMSDAELVAKFEHNARRALTSRDDRPSGADSPAIR